MIRQKREWIVYARKAGVKRTGYYAGFLLSTGAYRRVVLHDADGHRVTNKKTAEDLARHLYEEGVPGTAEGFGQFLESFWAAAGTYVRDKRDQGEPLSAEYQRNNYNNVRKHIRPALCRLGKDLLPVDRVAAELLKSILRTVGDKGLKGRTVNTVRQTFAVPMRAYWEGKLHPEKNPCTARLVPHFDEEPEERKIFTLAEARAFLAHDFGDPRLSAIQRQAAFTGMRLGECLGMQHGDLRPESIETVDGKGRAVTVTEYWIDVQHNWQEREPEGRRVKKPKKKSFGQVPVPPAVAQGLLKLEGASPWGGPFLYWGFQQARPYPKDIVERSYNAACRAIGITDEERKRRGLGMHAWRHWYDTYIKIDRQTLQKLMRHRSAEMTARYNHLTDDQRREAFGAVVGLLGAVSAEKRPRGNAAPARPRTA
jgi:integrase